MTKRQKTWVYSPPRPSKPKAPETAKREVERKAGKLVETVLKPRYIEPPPQNEQFNYIVDIYTKWYRNYFYFCAKYACPGPNALAPFFESKLARLEYLGGQNRFNLAFMRHTGEWIEIYHASSLNECLAAIKKDPFFQP